MAPLRWYIWFSATVILAAAETPSTALLVLNKNDSNLAIIDPSSTEVIARIPTGEGPHEVVASTDGKLAFVGNYGARTPGSTLSVIDVIAQKERNRVDLDPLRRPHGLAFADGKVYFTAEVNKLIGRYDPASNRVDWLLGTGQNGTHMVLLSKNPDRIFTANIGSDSITIMERGASPLDWSETVVPVGKGPEAIDLSPDGKQIWTAHSRDGGISIIDIASRKVIDSIDVHTKRSNRLKFTPDGKRVLISDLDGGEVIILDAVSHKEIKRLKMGRAPEGILMSPDGSRAYIAVSGDNYVAVLNMESYEIVGHISSGNGPDGMAWAIR